jgi:hypothetical protein
MRGDDEPATVPAKKSIRGSKSVSMGCWFAESIPSVGVRLLVGAILWLGELGKR